MESEETMTQEREIEAEGVVARLIEMATDSTDQEVDPRLLKAIKSAARSSDNEVRDAVRALMNQMKKPHSQVRYLAVLIIDLLFMRSKLFRTLLVVNFDQFLSLSIGFRRNLPLPPPSTVASTLRSKSIELLEKWNASFGIHYRQLRLGFDYLKNTLKFHFPNRLENAARLQQERREREIRSKQILLKKFQNFKESYSLIKDKIQSTIDEIGECIEILHAKGDDEFVSYIATDDDELEESRPLALQQIRLDALKEGQKVYESSENMAIFDVLRELLRLLISKHFPLVQKWMSVLVRVDVTDKFRDTALKEFIDLRNHILSAKEKCAELGCVFVDGPVQNDDEKDLWEDGKIEIDGPGESSGPNSEAKDSVNTVTSNNDKAPALHANKSSDTRFLNLPPEKRKLLSIAPVVEWGPFLDNWGLNRDAPANQRGLELESHWGRVDSDAVIPAEKIAELSVHRTVYKEQPVEIQPCNAPLKKGGLCQRRDLKACPFHGPIVPRDTEGNPIEQIPSSVESKNQPSASGVIDTDQDLDLDKLTVERLFKQAVKNVRESDIMKKTSKRAKLARVREHNEAVLRDAAIASTSYSQAFGEREEAVEDNRMGRKTKKPTLNSMLRKKITAKDRISKRLLSARATDASIHQLMQGEDLKYREAFPNQW
ncbi:UV-stimulated scaffold protein A protein [Dioscorea alata]|uniref:UV-stimulated scaffold protein A protein n=1 Tax=Dioscorea alata TaxID=55571 RepID=A0ACB7W3Z0_DIOAL|nr:UV-stimulated scaffold protein A protein [Dioscorea alata]